MPIQTNSPITWGELISTAKANLQSSIENLQGATIPIELSSSNPIEVNRIRVSTREFNGDVITYGNNSKIWTTVSWNDVEADFNNFLNYHHINSTDRANQLISTRLILNFFENLSLFYTNRLFIVYSDIGSKPKRLYYYNNGSSYSSWQGVISDIENPVQDLPATAEEISTTLSSLNQNLKNKAKFYEQSYTYYSTSCSCSSSCSSCSSSSSSCCSCLTIVHQDLSML